MTILDFFLTQETPAATHSWVLADRNPATPMNDFITNFADQIMQHRCRGILKDYNAWRECVEHGTPLSPREKNVLQAMIKPIVGLPSHPDHIPINHREGYMGEMLWYLIYQSSPRGNTIVHSEPPGFQSTDSGGDSLVIHRHPDGYLLFRLWENKKLTGNSGSVSGTVNTAYNQLDKKAMEYLARFTTIAPDTADPDLGELYGQLMDLWVTSSKQAAAGVAVTTSASHRPSRCFTTFGEKFPNLTNPVRLEGMVTVVDDFSDFVDKVRDVLWTGL